MVWSGLRGKRAAEGPTTAPEACECFTLMLLCGGVDFRQDPADTKRRISEEHFQVSPVLRQTIGGMAEARHRTMGLHVR